MAEPIRETRGYTDFHDLHHREVSVCQGVVDPLVFVSVLRLATPEEIASGKPRHSAATFLNTLYDRTVLRESVLCLTRQGTFYLHEVLHAFVHRPDFNTFFEGELMHAQYAAPMHMDPRAW